MNAPTCTQHRFQSCSRDPIGFEGGFHQYGYVNGAPISYFDPLGLFKVIGVTDDRRTIYDHGDGSCYYYVNNRRVATACPTLPEYKDPAGTSYLDGLKSIWDGQFKLQNLCKDSPCCSKADCFGEAQQITMALMSAWQNNYGQGPFADEVVNDPEPVGTWYCWNWVAIYMQALSTLDLKCFGAEPGVMIKSNDPRAQGPRPRTPEHWWVDIDSCNGDAHCSIDDGFLGGNPGCVHEGAFPPENKKPDWVVPTNPVIDFWDHKPEQEKPPFIPLR